MKKFILGILFGILIAGAVVYIFTQRDEEQEKTVKKPTSTALSKIRKNQQKTPNNVQENLQKFATDLMQAKSPQQMIKAIDEIIKLIKIKKRISMADISTVEEGINCEKLGVDLNTSEEL